MARTGLFRQRRWAKAAMLWLVAVAALAAPSAASAGAGAGGLAWKPCFEEDGTFECALMRVPLDYDKPGGATIRIALIRLPATVPAQRIGSLFLNPGGPGGSGVRLRARRRAVPLHARGPRALRPRRLRPARDRPQRPAALLRQREQWEPYFTRLRVPVTDAEEEQSWIAADRYLVARLRPAGRRDHRPHVHRQRGARPGPAAPGRRRRASSATSATPTARTSAPRTRTCSPAASARWWSTACSTRSRGRRARRRAPRCRSRRGCAATRAPGDAGGVLPPLRRRRPALRVRARRRARASPRSPTALEDGPLDVLVPETADGHRSTTRT